MSYLEIIIYSIIKIAVIFGVVLFVVAYMSWLERKLLARIQQRFGPNRVGIFGLLQPVADGIKSFLKEDIIPENADRVPYMLAPLLAMASAIMCLAVIPFGPSFKIFQFDMGKVQIADLNVGILYVLGIASIGVYGVFLAGWSSNNKYSLLGALRSSSQIFSYELVLGSSVVTVLMASGTLQLSAIVESQGHGFWNWWIFSSKWFFIPGLLSFCLYMISGFAETNRIPFDLPEAENELVAGYFTEYSSMKFALFFMAEYLNMIIVCSIATVLFLGGWMSPLPYYPFILVPGVVWFAAKTGSLLVFFIWVRGTMPRFRYDQLMNFGWKFMLPLALVNIFLAAIGLLLTQKIG